MSTLTPADLENLRNQHRPVDEPTLAREVRALIALGLTGADIAAAMRISVSEVAHLLDSVGNA